MEAEESIFLSSKIYIANLTFLATSSDEKGRRPPTPNQGRAEKKKKKKGQGNEPGEMRKERELELRSSFYRLQIVPSNAAEKTLFFLVLVSSGETVLFFTL